jgi:hypothetical protein
VTNTEVLGSTIASARYEGSLRILSTDDEIPASTYVRLPQVQGLGLGLGLEIPTTVLLHHSKCLT